VGGGYILPGTQRRKGKSEDVLRKLKGGMNDPELEECKLDSEKETNHFIHWQTLAHSSLKGSNMVLVSKAEPLWLSPCLLKLTIYPQNLLA
jgi:hypothetical protein